MAWHASNWSPEQILPHMCLHASTCVAIWWFIHGLSDSDRHRTFSPDCPDSGLHLCIKFDTVAILNVLEYCHDMHESGLASSFSKHR